jgi:hypothetical protein
MSDIDAYWAVESVWPYDGPHGPDIVTSAALALPRLVRYLNNATGPGHATTSLTCAATAYRITSHLAATADLLPQVLAQLARFLRAQAQNPTLYDDRYDRPAGPTALVAAADLDDAIKTVRGLAEALHRAAMASGHLGNREVSD